jgi:UDP-N-acetylmuramate dehydrogenase
MPSPGCVFSNTPNKDNHPVSRMLDMCNLKGFKVGNVMVSKEHANYIVNLGNGNAPDAIELINICKDKVYEKFGVEIETEIDFVGFFNA